MPLPLPNAAAPGSTVAVNVVRPNLNELLRDLPGRDAIVLYPLLCQIKAHPEFKNNQSALAQVLTAIVPVIFRGNERSSYPDGIIRYVGYINLIAPSHGGLTLPDVQFTLGKIYVACQLWGNQKYLGIVEALVRSKADFFAGVFEGVKQGLAHANAQNDFRSRYLGLYLSMDTKIQHEGRPNEIFWRFHHYEISCASQAENLLTRTLVGMNDREIAALERANLELNLRAEMIVQLKRCTFDSFARLLDQRAPLYRPIFCDKTLENILEQAVRIREKPKEKGEVQKV